MQCQNCEREIGDQEQAANWQGYIVCPTCRPALEDTVATDLPRDAVDPLDALAAAHGGRRRSTTHAVPATAGGAFIICPNPNCGYRGKGIVKSKGSTITLVILLLLWIVPGILYAIFFQGSTVICPRCGMKARDL